MSQHCSADAISIPTDQASIARGYVPKGADQAEVLRAIRAVANGEAILGPGIAQWLIGFFSASRPSVAPRIFPELTDRVQAIIRARDAGLG